MNIQNLVMENIQDKESGYDVKMSIKSENTETAALKNRILSPQSIIFSKDSPRFWPPHPTTLLTNNVFLPPSRPPITPIDTNNSTESNNSHSLSGFVDLSSDQNMICPLCKKIFRFEKNLLRHMQKTHSTGDAESVLKCKLCNYTTRHYSNMYVHIRTHTGDKPYSCSGCGASFTQGSSLKLHIKSRHEDNTSLFSLTKKPGKNNLTKLWTRVYKKDLSKFSNYGLGNYFNPFNVPTINNSSSHHELLVPFNNFMPYPRLPHLPYMSNCSPQMSNINHQNIHNFPMFLSRLPLFPANFRSENIDEPENFLSITNIINNNATEKSKSVRNKKAILSISDFVEDDKPISRLQVEEGDDFRSVKDKDISKKFVTPKMNQKQDILDKDEENNSEILSVVDFDIDESSEKSHSFKDSVTDFIKNLLCNQNPQNIDQLFHVLQSMGPSFMKNLKSFFPNKLLSPHEANHSPEKLSQIPFLNGCSGLRPVESKSKFLSSNGILPPCASRNNNILPFFVRPTFHSLLSQNNSEQHSDLSQPWSELFSQIGQISDKSLFHHQPSQSSTNHQSLRSAILPPHNMFGNVGYSQPLMKMVEKPSSKQFLQ